MRAFIAVDVPQEIRAKVAAVGAELTALASNLVPVKEDAVHVTLQFLGEISGSTAANVESAMQAIEMINFEISLSEIKTFGRRTVYVNVAKGAEALRELYLHISEQFDAEGIQFIGNEYTKYTPHVTVARVKGYIDKKKLFSFLQPYAHAEFGSFMAEAVVLKKSTLTAHGPLYEELYKAKLL